MTWTAVFFSPDVEINQPTSPSNSQNVAQSRENAKAGLRKRINLVRQWLHCTKNITSAKFPSLQRVELKFGRPSARMRSDLLNKQLS